MWKSNFWKTNYWTFLFTSSEDSTTRHSFQIDKIVKATTESSNIVKVLCYLKCFKRKAVKKNQSIKRNYYRKVYCLLSFRISYTDFRMVWDRSELVVVHTFIFKCMNRRRRQWLRTVVSFVEHLLVFSNSNLNLKHLTNDFINIGCESWF